MELFYENKVTLFFCHFYTGIDPNDKKVTERLQNG